CLVPYCYFLWVACLLSICNSYIYCLAILYALYCATCNWYPAAFLSATYLILNCNIWLCCVYCYICCSVILPLWLSYRNCIIWQWIWYWVRVYCICFLD